MPKKEHVPQLMKWHATLKEKRIWIGANEPNYNDKRGRYKPTERINVDQSPLPFVVHGKDLRICFTWSSNTWISQPGPGLAKRQCSLQVIFRPEGSQPRLAIFFCGQEKRISDDEKMTWHPDVDVFPIKCVVRSICMHQMV